MNSSSQNGVVSVTSGDGATPTDWSSPEMQRFIAKRYSAEKRFRFFGLLAVCSAGGFLLFFLWNIFSNGLSGFRTTEMQLPVTYSIADMGLTDADTRGPNAKDKLASADYGLIADNAIIKNFPKITDSNQQMDLIELLSAGATSKIRDHLVSTPGDLGKTVKLWVPVSSDLDMLRKNQFNLKLPEADRGVSDTIVAQYNELKKNGLIRGAFNKDFFTNSDSRDPELAGIGGAVIGTLFTLIVALLLSFPVGVLTAVYLEEFAPRNKLTDFIEVNINNLAAVPSIIFGLLGLAVFLGTFGMPRSAPLVGGLTLALMTLPTIVIASRNAIKAVPPSIRDAAMGVGASPLQVVTHHVIPLAMPGIMTGTIIGMARALGESAPLLMIGMRAFVVDTPQNITDPATVLPVQIFLWSDSVERGFIEKTSAAIVVLLAFLISMNAVAVYVRNRFERRW
jgi:phosphate transport system permease protein